MYILKLACLLLPVGYTESYPGLSQNDLQEHETHVACTPLNSACTARNEEKEALSLWYK